MCGRRYPVLPVPVPEEQGDAVEIRRPRLSLPSFDEASDVAVDPRCRRVLDGGGGERRPTP